MSKLKWSRRTLGLLACLIVAAIASVSCVRIRLVTPTPPAGSPTPTLPPSATVDIRVTMEAAVNAAVAATLTAQAPTATPSRTPPAKPATPTSTPSPTASPTSAPPTPRTPYVEVIVESANLRNGPGTVYDIISAAKKGQQFDALGVTAAGDWYRVCCVSTQKAWIAASLVKLTGPMPPVEKEIPPTPTAPPSPSVTAPIRSSSKGKFFQWMEDVTDLLPDRAIRVTSWAEDGRYVYLAGVIPNRQVYVLQIEKVSRSRVNTYALDHATVDWVTVGIKWDKIYAVTTAKEHDNESFSSQTWQWWRVQPGAWANLASTQHCEGGGSHELVETNNFLFYIGGYSTCGAWGMKIWRMDASEKLSSWSSPTGDSYYHLMNAVTTGNRILFSHFPAGGRTIFFEDLLEESNDFLKSYTDTGYQGDWAGIWDNGRTKVIFSGITQYDGGSVHVRDYPRTLDKRIYGNRSALLQAWSRNDGITYLLMRDDVTKSLLVLRADMALNIEDDGARYELGDFWGAKLMRTNEFNPGFIWNAADERVYLVSEHGIFAGAQSKEAQLTSYARGAMDPVLRQMADGSIWLAGHYQENWQPFYAISRDGGQSWSEPALLWEGAVYDMDMAQGPDGRIWVVWASSSPDPYDPHVRTTTDSGKTWSDVRRLSAPPDHDTVMSVIPMSAQETWLCWEGGCIASSDGGQGWGSVRAMPSFGWNNTTFSRTRDGRLWTVAVVQTGDYEKGKALIQLQWSRDNGQSWSPLTTVSSALVAPKTREAIRPVARMLEDSGGRLWLVFYAYESRTDSSQVWYMTSNDGVEWSYPYAVTTDPSFHASYFSNISLAEVNGQVWAVYASDKSGKWQVYRQVLALQP